MTPDTPILCQLPLLLLKEPKQDKEYYTALHLQQDT